MTRIPDNTWALLLIGAALALGLWVVTSFLKLWVLAAIAGTGITFWDLIGMRLRKVDPKPIICGKVILQRSGCSGVSHHDLEALALSGGNVMHVTRAMAKAKETGVDLDWKSACKMDREGRDVIEYVERLVR